LFDLDFTFDFVNFDEKAAPFGFDQVMRVDRSVFDAGPSGKIPQPEFIGNLREIPFCER
jgi:hypothetical protein